jgi:molybdopterin-containing oxidoreductase family iron-sulfur binding subunit
LHGDELEDVVTNGEDTFRLKKLLKDRGAYRQFEELGTKPRVYYLPPVERAFPFEDAIKPQNTKE